MIDCHVHFPQIDMIGSYGEQLLDWLTKFTFPAEQRFASPQYAAKATKAPHAEAALHGLQENIKARLSIVHVDALDV